MPSIFRRNSVVIRGNRRGSSDDGGVPERNAVNFCKPAGKASEIRLFYTSVVRPGWRNGRRSRLKICRVIPYGFESRPGYHLNYSQKEPAQRGKNTGDALLCFCCRSNTLLKKDAMLPRLRSTCFRRCPAMLNPRGIWLRDIRRRGILKDRAKFVAGRLAFALKKFYIKEIARGVAQSG